MNQTVLVNIGIAVIFIGIIIIIISTLAGKSERSEVKVSFFGLLGFIPFGFSNDKKLFIITMVIAIVIILVLLFYYLRYFR